MAELVAKTYGDALFDAALDGNLQKELWEEAVGVLQVLRENPEFLGLLSNPRLSREQVSEILDQVFDGKVHNELCGLMHLLISKNRQKDMVRTLEYFVERCKEYYHVGTVYVTAPMPLSGVQQQRLEADLLRDTHYRKLEMHYKIDPSIIGGLVIRIGDRVMDTSVRGKIDRLTNELYKIQL